MKKITVLLFFLLTTSLYGQVSITPFAFGVNDEITITIDANSSATNCNNFNNPNKVYIHSGIGDDSNPWGFSVKGNWGQDDGVGEMTNNGDGTWSITFTPQNYFSLNGTQAATATKMGMVFRNEDGSQEFKDNGCTDFFFDIGAFQIALIEPTQSITIVNSGTIFTITAQASLTADFVLKANNVVVDTQVGLTDYSYNYVVNENTNFSLEATNNGEVKSVTFQAFLQPNEAPVPNGLKDGINFDPIDDTKTTLVLYAPNKSIVHVIGDFNNWQVEDNYIMNKDSASDRFWIELTGLTPQYDHMYQYLVDLSIRIADPYSTLILDEDDDPYIDNTTFPNLPNYPSGMTTHDVTWLRTGDPDYNWQITNFVKPEKTDLVVYELLIRDFDELHSFNAVKNRLDYLQSLGINAIELMPVSEFDGNLSWGYNPNYHMALDKYYGTPTTFKQLIDECHARGIAVILDVVYNQAESKNPYYRLWNPGENPFFNQTATHSYSPFNDFNHSQQATRDYVKRTVEYWIEEFHIDGFRWDLTKGFTQNCTGNEACTNDYNADRVAVLEEYADYCWSMDPDHYVVFEHLGTDFFGDVNGDGLTSIDEEKDWASYRADEGKGIMLWNKQTDPYNEATMGYHDNGKSNFSNVSYQVKGFDMPLAMSYMESHDEQRLMYKNLLHGNSNGNYSVKNLNTALERMQAAGAFFFTVPGPKLIWQFGELGYEIDINFNGRTGEKPIHWDYLENSNRKAIYNTWSKLIDLKHNVPIFKTSDFNINASNSNGLKTIHLTLATATGDEIKYVTILGNFGITTQSIIPNFQETGTWYNLLDRNTPETVTNTTAPITLAPGSFRIYGNNPYIDPNDLDSDGVVNSDDNCSNTPLGTVVDVNGCEIFTLPVNNFSLQISSETCRSSNNGSISITANLNFNYAISITKNGVNISDTFTTNYSKTGLQAGDYLVCISVEGHPSYEQCFDINITEPEDLSVLSRVSNSKGIVSLDLSGSSSYQITFNDSSFETSKSNVQLNLENGANFIKVEGEKICQGVYEKTIFFSPEMIVFPNPVTDNKVTVYLGNNDTNDVHITLYTILGEFVYSKDFNAKDNMIQLDFPAYIKGIYLLNVITNKDSRSFKLIKQ